ncbi:hypothetical protein [Dictyobacter kobayashii]|uniref:Uncharacterized protein n=1 Tax=Dictyobacter kobayashii TaxID=2014872 RepID=A0A402ADR9_9CHLR|nr:hypothetical protein [Dictyobacter kobayashii]GCE17257.1 hypothetical protein KDK_10570 [Dictyobacter kobayashii]
MHWTMRIRQKLAPVNDSETAATSESQENETTPVGAARHLSQSNQVGDKVDSAHSETEQIQNMVADAADAIADLQHQIADDAPEVSPDTPSDLKDIIANQDEVDDDLEVSTDEITGDGAISSEETIQSARISSTRKLKSY